MAEELQRNRLYAYTANSNLVLEAERDNKRRDEGTAEVETLFGKLDKVRMGDKLAGVKGGVMKRSVELDDRIEKSRKKKSKLSSDDNDGTRSKFVPQKSSSMLIESEELGIINYRPKTRETRQAYEEILSVLQSCLGDQSHDIIKGAGDEVIAILKNDAIRSNLKQTEVEKIIGTCRSDQFSKLVNLGKRLLDFSVNTDDGNSETAKLDDEMGVAVVFDDEEDNSDRDIDEVGGSDISDDEGGVEARGSGQLKGAVDEEDNLEVDDKYDLSIFDLDAHWLQRHLSKYYPDANISAKLAEDTLNALNIVDERSCENKLVLLLDFDKFEFIKLLLKNRYKIHFCIRLLQSQYDEERASIEAEMVADSMGRGIAILRQLKQKASAESWTQDRIGEFAQKARREAKALNQIDSTIDRHFSAGISDLDETLLMGSQQNMSGEAFGDVGKVIDLDSLSFRQGSHVMTNKACELPEKSWRALKKGYEEVHVPAVRPIIPASEKLVEIADLPEWCHDAFAGVRSLNRIQSKMVNAALLSSENILLCAPTGAGKTNVALLCMLNEIGNHRQPDGSFDLTAFKIVYIAPMKALVQECVQNFSKRLGPYGISVKELSGDQNLTRDQIEGTQVIVTTPEKWDIVTRKSGDRTYTQLVRLMIIDEIHLLHDERGPVLEAIVARTIRQVEVTQEMVRLVGLSATLPNFEDVATFLRVSPEKGLFFFDNSFRPVPLQQQYIGITEKKALKRFQLMNEICYEKVLQHAGRNQILIFTHSRADTVKTAKALRDLAVENDTVSNFIKEDSASREILREEANTSVKNADLKALLPFGFAFHHAGLVRSDRTLVEDLFADKHIQVLVSTATLAWGVNLPCHTVIIKGTQMYSPVHGRWIELSPLDILQMMGRAGRYGLDSEGEGIIMTTHSELQFYLSLLNQQLPIESQLIKKLPDMLNAEIVLGNISNVREAASWLGYTYLYVRMLRNPELYGVSSVDSDSDPSLFRARLNFIHSAASILEKNSLVKYDRKSGIFQATALGRVSSYYYVTHESMRTYNDYLKPTMSDIELFRLFSMSSEFKDMHVRDEEKLELTKLLTRVPIPVKENIDEASAKVNVLLQSYISRLKLGGFSLAADMIFIQQSACRLMRALFEIALKRDWSSLAQKILTMCKIVERRTWLSQSPLRQFTAIPEVIIRKLEKSSDIPWSRYFDLKANDLGELVKLPKMGKTLLKYVHSFPKLELSAHFLPITRSLLKVVLTITPDFQFDAQLHDTAQLFWVLVEDVDGKHILHYESFLLRAHRATESHTLNFFVPLFEPLPPQYFVKVISDRWLHSETTLPVSFRHLLLPSKFPPSTELLDLQPLPISSIGNKTFQAVFDGTKYFNAIQTQVFSSLYESTDNVLICAPESSEKSSCAIIALLRHFSSHVDGKCVYLSPMQDAVDVKYSSWMPKFSLIGKSVAVLTGEVTSDLKLIDNSDLIMTTPEVWDTLARRWKQRKSIQNISLYIFDNLHLIGGTHGPIYEAVVSRSRYIASQIDKKVRIVGLASSIANAKELADWIGVPATGLFNFSPGVRPVPLELYFAGYDLSHAGSRLLAMSKPAFNIAYSGGKKIASIVFVPSLKQVQLTAIDFVTFATAAGQPYHFFSGTESESTDLAAFIKDTTLKQTVVHGVGFIHCALSSADKEIVQSLYARGIISLLVCSHSLCWSLGLRCQNVIVMDTVYFDGKDHTYVDYSVGDMLKMLGLASLSHNEFAKGYIMCSSSKKEYLKRVLQDPLPIESHLDVYLHDCINTEVVSRTIENKQDAVDYLTWTFYYRRISQNPNYYNLQGVSHRHLSDHLSELVESITTDLQRSKCVSVDEDFDLSPLNHGMIASYYSLQYTTVELLVSSVTQKTRTKGFLDILAAASEFLTLPLRSGDDSVLQSLLPKIRGALSIPQRFDDPAAKVLILLQSHFSRFGLPNDLHGDLVDIIKVCAKLIPATVDVVSSHGWLRPALSAMEMSQMITQGMWAKDSVLLQIPHFDDEVIGRCLQFSPPIETVFDLIEMENADRVQLLSMNSKELSDVALFCNAYPSVDLKYSASASTVSVGDAVKVQVKLEFETGDDDDTFAISTRFPSKRPVGWWLVLGDYNANALFSIKKLGKSKNVSIEFNAPEDPGEYSIKLYLMCDSYLGCDQEFEFDLTVIPDI